MTGSASSQWQRILEEEESLWRRGHPCFEASDHHDMQLSLLDQCPNIPRIHGYFSNLELRKCCLKLAGANTTFSTMRVVSTSCRSSFNGQAGNTVWASRQTENGLLPEKELNVYQSSLLCCNFPVLSVPDPPTEPTPTFSRENSSLDKRPHVRDTGARTIGHRSLLSPGYSGPESTQWKSSNTPAELYDSFRHKVQHHSLETQHSRSNSQTSGVESMCSATSDVCDEGEEEAMAVLAPESLCDWLRRMFGLSQEAARLYEKKIYQPHRKKTFAKILVEELCKQLSMLESDSHPFYNSNMFMSRETYTRWQHQERARIGHMIQKFWHHSLPTVKSSSHLEVAQYHEHYRHLLKKVVMFEGHLRGSQSSGHLGCEMSLASRRLLREFSCRHGIGEFYQKIVFLELLADSFSSHMSHTKQLISQLLELRQLLPAQMGKSMLVATEYEILSKTLTLLQGHCKHVLTRIKRIYEESQIFVGVGNMIRLLALLVELKAQLDVDNSPTVKQLLRVFTKENLHSSYERHKVIARGDLELDPRTEEITPKLINRLIINIKDEVCDYKRNFAPAFQRYLDVVQFAASVLYDLLMEDVTTLCVTSNQKQESGRISLPLLGLVYRLDQLDRDPCWQALISPVQQTWRREFFSLVLKWEKKLEQHAEKFLLQCVGADRFVTLRPVLVPTLDDPIMPGSRCTSTQSHVSIAVSEFSAFSAFRSHLSPSSIEGHASHEGSSSPSEGEDGINENQNEEDSIAEDALVFKTAITNNDSKITTTNNKLVTSKRGGLLARDLVPERCVSAPVKFVSFECTRSRENSELSEDGWPVEQENTNKNSGKSKMNKTEEENNKEINGKVVTVENDNDGALAYGRTKHHKQNIVPEEKLRVNRQAEGFTERNDSTGDLIGQSAFTGIRKLRSHSLLEEKRLNPRSQSALDFSIPEISSSPLYKSLSRRPHKPLFDIGADVGNALLETDESVEFPGRPLHVSSSAVEVVMVLKRMTHSVKTLSDTLYPNQKEAADMAGSPEDETTSSSSDMFIYIKQNIIMRWKLYTALTEMISEMVSLYTYNMLSMDMCGESNLQAKQILGAQVVCELKSLYRQKRVWGCRHMVSGQDCKAFSHSRGVTFLADKYEPVTREMCTRVNNLLELSYLLEELFSAARQSLCLHHTVEAARCCHLVLDDDSHATCQAVMASVREGWRALVQLMVHRLSLFVKDSLTVLQQLEVSASASMESIYHPLIRFLTNYSIALRAWLHSEVYTVMVRELWDTIIKLFEDLVSGLIDQQQMLSVTAERLLQLIAHLMKLLCGKDGRLDLDYAESRAEKCLDTLSLCTAPTIRLILIHRILRLESQTSDIQSESGEKSHPLPPKPYLQSMYRDLHQARKCFTGTQLVNWILLHPLEDSQQETVNRKQRHGHNAEGASTSHSRPSKDQKGTSAQTQWSPLRGFDLARAQNMANLLLKKGVIYQLDKPAQGSFVQEQDIYPDVVHYSTSSLSKLRSFSFNQGLNQTPNKVVQSPSMEKESTSKSKPMLTKQSPGLKRITSAPQFSLGMSPIDVSMLRSELEFRQYQGQLVSDSDSCTDGGQLSLNERTRRRIERLMQRDSHSHSQSSSEELDQARVPGGRKRGGERSTGEGRGVMEGCGSAVRSRGVMANGLSGVGNNDKEMGGCRTETSSFGRVKENNIESDRGIGVNETGTTGTNVGEVNRTNISSQLHRNVHVHEKEISMQNSGTSNASSELDKHTSDLVETAEEQQLDDNLAQRSKGHSDVNQDNTEKCDLVITAEVHSPVVSQQDAECSDIPRTCDIKDINADVSGTMHLKCSTPNRNKDDSDSVSSSSTIKEPTEASFDHGDIVRSSSRPACPGDGFVTAEDMKVQQEEDAEEEDTSGSSSVLADDAWQHSTVSGGEYGLSSSIESSFTSRSAFQNTSHHFYSFSDGTEHLADCLEHIISFLDHMSSAEGEFFQQQLSKDIDHFQKEHPCFGYQFSSTQQLEPQFILKILKCRSYHDYVAKHFLLLLPQEQKREFSMQEESMKAGCFGFF